ncbi:MAG TPA: mannuronate-specific alginate lyase [Verrucomicrobiae bacterium]|nr:mannuronate-specific alginate lyase [Verrucomicrobiae bacterium]
MRASAVLAAALGLALSGCAIAAPSATSTGATLLPPPGFTAAVKERKGGGGDDDGECAKAPKPFTADLAFPSKYEGSDAARDDLNLKAEAQYEAQIAEIRELERHVSSMTANYIRSGRVELLNCTLGWLDTWASAGALLGDAETHTGKSVRKWALASVASAWIRLKFSTSQPLAKDPARAGRIEGWLAKVGDKVVQDWRDQPLRNLNNHQYWAAWAVMANAIALNRRDFYDWALAQYRTANKQVDSEGYLPNELKRDTRALSYHNYSLGPLTMIAAFAKANGSDLGDSRDSMQRLSQRVLDGVDNPKNFEKKAGAKQTREGIDEASKFAWLEAYCWTFSCNTAYQSRMEKLRPLRTYRLGGDLTELFAGINTKDKNKEKAKAKASEDSTQSVGPKQTASR